MPEPFLGEIRLVAFDFAPKGYALCSGQLLAISQNQALFALLGTFYGGNGQTTFALPDLRSRVPISFGQGPGLSNFNQGQVGGEERHTLTTSEIPPHLHTQRAFAGEGTTRSPVGGAVPAAGGAYAGAGNAIGQASAGGGQPHENRQPSTALNFVIALQGIFPSRN